MSGPEGSQEWQEGTSRHDRPRNGETASSTPKVDLARAISKPHRFRRKDEVRAVFREAFRAYCSGWEGKPEPSFDDIAMRFDLPLIVLLRFGTKHDWQTLRANTRVKEALAVTVARQELAERVEKVTLESAERFASKVVKHYEVMLEQIQVIGKDQPDGVPSMAPRETSCGAPLRSEMDEKIFLSNQLIAGYSKMLDTLKKVGLVKQTDDGDGRPRGQVLDPTVLAKLSLTIIAQKKQTGEKRLQAVPVDIDVKEIAPPRP